MIAYKLSMEMYSFPLNSLIKQTQFNVHLIASEKS